MAKAAKDKNIEALVHSEARRKHIPTAELQSFVEEDEAKPKRLRYPRNTDLDPQLVWRGKDEQDAEDLGVDAVPIYIQEKIKPEVIIADLKRRSDKARAERAEQEAGFTPDMFHDFNGLPDKESELEFYQHDKNWANRMILGDSLLVMASLAEKEALKGQVQCIYFDPPYGIKFNSNWQPSTKSRDVKDGKQESLTREPEMIRAFRDTWADGIHSYLSYLRDRLTVARDLLTDSGSIFVQIGDENVHLVRALMDEVFGDSNFVSLIAVQKTSGQTAKHVPGVIDFLLFYARRIEALKFRELLELKPPIRSVDERYVCVETATGEVIDLSVKHKRGDIPIPEGRVLRLQDTTSQTGSERSRFGFQFEGSTYYPSGKRGWSFAETSKHNLAKSGRLFGVGAGLRWKNYHDESSYFGRANNWTDLSPSGFGEDRIFVVQTMSDIIGRCILMTTDPGDLVLDPTCGSGTTAYVSEQWGRRWITIDTSRVALALARQRLMAGRFPSYLLQDSSEGAQKEGELTKKPPREGPFTRSVRQGFIYERVPHVTLKSIANNGEIDVIWDEAEKTLTRLREKLNQLLGEAWEEWEVPQEHGEGWGGEAKKIHAAWWEGRRKRQAEIDASIARNADIEYLVDRAYEDKARVRVTGPFTVESLSPHRVLPADEDESLLDAIADLAAEEGRPAPKRTRSLTRAEQESREAQDFNRVVLENLKKSGVQNTKKGEALLFTELKPWPGGKLVHAEGRYTEGETEKRVAVTIGPEYGTVSWALVRDAAREAVEAFDTLVVCGFAFEPRVNDDSLSKFGRLTVLKARMNSDLHMAGALKPTGAGSLFVVFGEPDIKIHEEPPADDGTQRLSVEILGVDIFDPTTGEVRSSDVNDIACWFVDTDYDEESFFVRQAYFLGGNDPYKRLKTTLKAEIDEEAWASLYSAKSRPFDRPATGKIAVKVINHYGDEVLKVFGV